MNKRNLMQAMMQTRIENNTLTKLRRSCEYAKQYSLINNGIARDIAKEIYSFMDTSSRLKM